MVLVLTIQSRNERGSCSTHPVCTIRPVCTTKSITSRVSRNLTLPLWSNGSWQVSDMSYGMAVCARWLCKAWVGAQTRGIREEHHERKERSFRELLQWSSYIPAKGGMRCERLGRLAAKLVKPLPHLPVLNSADLGWDLDRLPHQLLCYTRKLILDVQGKLTLSLILMSNSWIRMINCVCPSGWSSHCLAWHKNSCWMLRTLFLIRFFHTCLT